MLDLSLFRRPAMIGVSAVAVAISASIFALFLYLTLYIQDDLGYGPLAAGVRFLPLTMLSFLVAPVAGKLTVRVSVRWLMGIGLVLIGLACLLMATTHPDSGWTVLLPGFVAGGIGVGMVNPVLASSAIAVVPPERSGMASGANSTFRQVGIATGIAALGAVFQTQIQHKTQAALAASAVGRQVLAHGGTRLTQALDAGAVRAAAADVPAVPRHALLHAYRIGFSGTLNELMVIGAAIALLGAVVTLVTVRQRDFVTHDAPVGATPGGEVEGGVAVPAGGDLTAPAGA